jgi:flagellar hook-length control protein FliK
MQTLDVRIDNAIPATGKHSVQGGKTGAETARNGSSFLAMIEKMIAGTREGALDAKTASNANMAGRGAGDVVPGEENTLIKPGAGKKNTLASMKKGTKSAEIALPAQEKAVNKDQILAETTSSISKQPKIPGSGLKKDLTEAALTEKPVPEEGTPKNGSDDNKIDTSMVAVSLKTEALPAKVKPDVARFEIAQKDDRSAKIEGAAEKTERKDKKSFISVRDNRRDADAAYVARESESPLVKTTEIRDDNSADMSIAFRPSEHTSTAGENTRMIERKEGEGQNFASMLSQELKNNAADFVKTGQIVLRENNTGTIRLTLHPESLGNVRISLELSDDKKISGKIVVSSQEAYDAFNENLSGLSDAFVEGGFESAGFDLSWSGSGDGSTGNNDARMASITPFYASSIPDVMSLADSADIQKSWYGGNAMQAINVFA